MTDGAGRWRPCVAVQLTASSRTGDVVVGRRRRCRRRRSPSPRRRATASTGSCRSAPRSASTGSCSCRPSARSCAGTRSGPSGSSTAAAHRRRGGACSRGACGCPSSSGRCPPPRCSPSAVAAEPGGRAARRERPHRRHRPGGRVVARRAGAGGGPGVARRHRAARRDRGRRRRHAARRRDGGRERSAPFGVYVHVPFCAHRCDYCAFATWTDRAHLVDAYLAAVRTEIDRAVDAGMPAADTVFVGGGTPTLVPAEGLASVLRAIPLAAGAEVTVECNPDDVTEAMFETYARGRRHPRVDRRAVDGAARARRARPHARPGERRDAPSPPSAPSACRRSTSTSSTARWGSSSPTGGPRCERDARPRASARVGLRPDRRGRHAAGRRPRPPSRRRRAGRRVRARRRAADGRRAGQLRGVQLGPAGARVPAQPPLLGPARLPRLRLRRPLAPRRSALVEPAHAGALHRRRGRRPLDGGRRRDARRRAPAASRGCSWRCARRPACRSTPSTATSSPASSSAASDRWVLTRRGRLMANEVAVRLR